jgi:hypothetical protein
MGKGGGRGDDDDDDDDDGSEIRRVEGGWGGGRARVMGTTKATTTTMRTCHRKWLGRHLCRCVLVPEYEVGPRDPEPRTGAENKINDGDGPTRRNASVVVPAAAAVGDL